MKKIILLVLVITMVLVFSANAFDIKFENTTDKTLIYMLYWLVPGWEKVPITGGELDTGESNILTSGYAPGPYIIIWKSFFSSNDTFYKSYLFKVEKSKCMVISTPKAEPIIE